jgi:GIY-YIG catalytic domain
MAYIYAIVNKKNKKMYIGETKQKDIKRRWQRHKDSAKGDLKGCPLLYHAFKKYGIENFEFKVLLVCFDQDRFRYEREYIKRFNTKTPKGYNFTDGGVGLECHTEETKVKISQSLKRYYQKNGIAGKSMEAILKHREDMARAVGIRVQQLTLDGVMIDEYPSLHEASRQTSVNKYTISQCLYGRFSQAGGYKWKRVGSNPDQLPTNFIS